MRRPGIFFSDRLPLNFMRVKQQPLTIYNIYLYADVLARPHSTAERCSGKAVQILRFSSRRQSMKRPGACLSKTFLTLPSKHFDHSKHMEDDTCPKKQNLSSLPA
jgi:hypothetical protein